MSRVGLEKVLEKFSSYIGNRANAWGQINIAGGEPFLCKELEWLLQQIHSQGRSLRYSILSNGTILSWEHVEMLQRYPPLFIQVSIDGTEKKHDSIRGKGAYRKAVLGMQKLVANGIRTIISFTAHRTNYKEFADVVQLGKDIGVAKVWADRVIPSGRGRAFADTLLSPDETRWFTYLIKYEQLKARMSPWCSTEITSNRALQFLSFVDPPYSCSAGKNLVALLPNGNLLACRRLPIVLGNIHRHSFAEIFENNPLVSALHETQEPSAGCEQCFFAKFCRGGLRCLSYAVYGSPNRADPGCWRARNKK